MIKDVLQSIANVEIYPIIALISFVISFVAITFKALLMDKAEVSRISRLPLDESEFSETPTETAGDYFNQAENKYGQN